MKADLVVNIHKAAPKPTYVDNANMMDIPGGKLKIYVNEKDLEHFREEHDHLYLEGKSATGAPRLYWFTDAKDAKDRPIAEATDFERVDGECEDLFTLTLELGKMEA